MEKGCHKPREVDVLENGNDFEFKTSRKMGTLVLQLQGTEFLQQPSNNPNEQGKYLQKGSQLTIQTFKIKSKTNLHFYLSVK